MPRTETLLVKQMGLQPYAETWLAMRDYTDRRDQTSRDQLWLLEHPPVFTLGQAGKPEHLLHPGDIPVIKSDRGGLVTYHGPGQLMVYLLLDLRRARLGVRGLVTLLEQSVIDLLAAKGIQATARREAPGVYVGEAKLAAVGLRVRHGCCFHGLSLNVAMDLRPFEAINPCGYPGLPVCQLSDFLPDTDLRQVQGELSQHLAQGLGYTLEYEPQQMGDPKDHLPPSRATPESHQRGKSKLSRIPVKVTAQVSLPRKPPWIRTKSPTGKEVMRIRRILREKGLSSVCEEAACPNLGECFHQGTATFMIMGDICTRRCPFCDVAHGKPQPLDPAEPAQLAEAIAHMGLKYVVITSVDRDDLRDGGAGHFAACIAAVRQQMPQTKVEVLVPDFRGRVGVALEALGHHPPDLFNHNLETVPRLYRQARPGADYLGSLKLLQAFKAAQPALPTKSGLMLGLGETHQETLQVLRDLRDHDCEMLTLGQYLQPSRDHLPVQRFVTPEEFEALRREAEAMGFTSVASGPMVRSSYHADLQANPFFGE